MIEIQIRIQIQIIDMIDDITRRGAHIYKYTLHSILSIYHNEIRPPCIKKINGFRLFSSSFRYLSPPLHYISHSVLWNTHFKNEGKTFHNILRVVELRFRGWLAGDLRSFSIRNLTELSNTLSSIDSKLMSSTKRNFHSYKFNSAT